MKVLYLFFIVLGALCCQSLMGQVKFAASVQHLGVVPEDTVHLPTVWFRYKNIGKTVTSVSRVKVSCGCLKAVYSSHPLLPGKSDSIRIIFNPAGHPGVFDRKVWVYFSGSPRPYELRLKGVVKAVERRRLYP